MGTKKNGEHLAAPKSPEKRRAAAISVVIASAVLVQRKFSANFDKMAQNDSKQTGKEWLDELLAGHPKHFYNYGAYLHLIVLSTIP
jgi:hypothetical protein